MGAHHRFRGIHVVATKCVVEVDIALQAAVYDNIDRPVARYIYDCITVDSARTGSITTLLMLVAVMSI